MLLHFAFLFLVINSSAYASPVIQCEKLFGTHEIFYLRESFSDPRSKFYQSPEWKRISVRDPAQPILNRDYLYRTYQSVAKVFGPWFLQKGPLKDLPLSEVMRLQHIVLVTEETGGDPYVGATLIANGRVPTPLIAGQYRTNGHRAHSDGHPMSFRIEAKLPGENSPHLEAMREWYRRDSSPDKIIEPTEDFPDPISNSHAVVDVIRLPRLQERIKILNEISENYITHHYPAARDLPLILEAMEMVMRELRQQASRGQNKAWPKFFRCLAEYLYLGIHAHPFESGNFSLIMSEVNFILMHNNLRGLGHGHLDFLGLSVPFEEFQNSMMKRLFEVNLNDPIIESLRTSMKIQQDISLNITAHISELGDARFRDGSIIEDVHLRKAIEGIYIVPPALPAGVKLEYKGRIQSDGETAWLEAGNFMGTTGQHKALESIAFRLTGPGSDRFEVNYKIRAGDREWTTQCKNGAVCESIGQSKAITALVVSVKTVRN